MVINGRPIFGFDCVSVSVVADFAVAVEVVLDLINVVKVRSH